MEICRISFLETTHVSVLFIFADTVGFGDNADDLMIEWLMLIKVVLCWSEVTLLAHLSANRLCFDIFSILNGEALPLLVPWIL